MYDASKPYNDLPNLPDASKFETVPIMRSAISLAAETAELNQRAHSLPNPSILMNTITLLEARSSSEIENVMTTDDELFDAQSSEAAFDPTAKEVHRYREALLHGWKETRKRPLTTRIAAEICSILKYRTMDVRQGEARIVDKSTNEIIYTPPLGEKSIRDKLDSLWFWLYEDNGVSPLIKAAAAHYQFEAIHPFSDGNGRTGRILLVLYLVSTGVLLSPVMWLSGSILKHRSDYNAMLKSATEASNLETFTLWMTNTMEQAAARTSMRILYVLTAMQETKAQLDEFTPRMSSTDLINAIFSWPTISANMLVEANVVASRTTALKYLRVLSGEPLGILREYKMRGNSRFWNNRLHDALTKDVHS